MTCPWPANEAFEIDSTFSGDSGYGSDDTFHRILDSFPKPPATKPQKLRPSTSIDHLGELKSWDWAQRSRLSGSTVFSADWNAPVLSRETLISPKNIDEFNHATNNISIYRRTTRHNQGPLRTFFDDASISSPTLRPTQWTSAAHGDASKRDSALHKAKIVAKKSAKRANCFSPDDEDDGDHGGRKGSTSTISTIVSSIAEITDNVSQMKWRLYFAKAADRRRVLQASWVNVGGKM
jgi:hypothetical protein